MVTKLNTKIALIDADSFIYKAGFALEEEIDGKPYVDLRNAEDYIQGLINEIMFTTDCDDYELWLTGSDNFRYKIAKDNLPDEYKHNRKESRKPDKYNEMRDYLVHTHRAKVTPFCEADDVVVAKKTESPDKYILCAIDKDVLNQSEGTHYNYGTGKFQKVTLEESIYYSYYQTLTGDTTDGYKGCKNIGPVKAKRILGEPGEFNERELWARVLKAYHQKQQRYKEALATMRLANMHQLVRNDKGKFILKLWEVPKKGESKIDTIPF